MMSFWRSINRTIRFNPLAFLLEQALTAAAAFVFFFFFLIVFLLRYEIAISSLTRVLCMLLSKGPHDICESITSESDASVVFGDHKLWILLQTSLALLSLQCFNWCVLCIRAHLRILSWSGRIRPNNALCRRRELEDVDRNYLGIANNVPVWIEESCIEGRLLMGLRWQERSLGLKWMIMDLFGFLSLPVNALFVVCLVVDRTICSTSSACDSSKERCTINGECPLTELTLHPLIGVASIFVLVMFLEWLTLADVQLPEENETFRLALLELYVEQPDEGAAGN